MFPLSTAYHAGLLAGNLNKIGMGGAIFTVIVSVLIVVRRQLMKNKTVLYGPTWGCGYTAANARQQYTGTSYAENFSGLAAPVLNNKKEFRGFNEEEIFPSERTFGIYPRDIFKLSIKTITDFIVITLKKIARLQTGNIQHYILYAFLFFLVLLLLLIFKIV